MGLSNYIDIFPTANGLSNFKNIIPTNFGLSNFNLSNLESFQLITPQLKIFQLDDFSNYTWVDNYYQNNNISRIDSQSLTFKDKLSLYKKTTRFGMKYGTHLGFYFIGIQTLYKLDNSGYYWTIVYMLSGNFSYLLD